MSSNSIESTIFFTNRVFVYDLRNATNVQNGYRAADYSSTPHMWAGQLALNSGIDAEGNDKLSIVLEHDPSDNGKTGVFAQCTIKPGTIQDAVDSSRYYVIRVENEQTGQYIMLMVGFPNKAHAFDFKHELAAFQQKKTQAAVQHEYQDYSLKEKTITLDVNALRPKAPAAGAKQDAVQTVSRPAHVERISLNMTGQTPVRGRRTNNQATSTAGVGNNIQQPMQQQSQQSQQLQQPMQQQQQQLQRPVQQSQPKVDIFADMLTPTTSPQQQQPQQQQSTPKQDSGNSLLDGLFGSPDASNQVAQRQSANTTPNNTNTSNNQTNNTKSNDPFDFSDFNF